MSGNARGMSRNAEKRACGTCAVGDAATPPLQLCSRRPVSAGAWCLQPAALWQSSRAPSPYVMYSLQHGVNLSRRACRICVLVFVLVGLFGIGAAMPRSANPDNTLMYPKPDHEPIPKDINRPYDGVMFGPMGPNRKDEPVTEKITSTTQESQENNKKDAPKRYQVVSVSFHRVETPFIIGLWIFCASLAKIGKN